MDSITEKLLKVYQTKDSKKEIIEDKTVEETGPYSDYNLNIPAAEYLKKIIDSKDGAISSLLLSNNLVNILASSLATAFFYDLFGVTGIFYSTLLMTFLLVIFAEVLPKTYAIKKPTRTALLIGPFIYYLNKTLSPFVFLNTLGTING